MDDETTPEQVAFTDLDPIKKRLEMKYNEKLKREKIYRFLSAHGYKETPERFNELKDNLDEQLAHDFKGTTTQIIGEMFFKFKDDYFNECLFGDRIKEMIQALFNAHFSNRILDRRIMKTAIYELESILHAIDVFDYCSKTEEYGKLYEDAYHRQRDHLPQTRNLMVIKDTQCWVLISMFKYFSIMAEYEALRLATGFNDFELVKQHRASIKYTKQTPFLEIYNQYDQSAKHVEDDYIFMNACIARLLARIEHLPFKIKTFDLNRFRPKKATIEKIIEAQLIGNKPFFEDKQDPYIISEYHVNPLYLHSVMKLYTEVTTYMKGIVDEKELINANKWIRVKEH